MGVHAPRTARRRKLGSELKALREAAAVSVEQAAQRIHGDNSKISRLETGRQRITRLELDALLELYALRDEHLRSGLVALATEARKRGWWRQYSELLRSDFQEVLSLESDAATIQAFQPMLIPGLLQTPAYATAVLRELTPGFSEEELDSYLSIRMARQEIFTKPDPPHYLCVLTEGALRQEVGGAEAQAQQLCHLRKMSKPPQLTIQVLPYAQGVHVGMDGPFSIYSYPDPMDLDVVGVEYLDGKLYLEEERPVSRYRMAFDQLRSCALSSRQSLELISHIARDLESR
ncbi:helix-turn-helix domain-containing protein [Streptomyces iconiensis]|uniref:Helix-turn-helix transcriptional regulator n=1 Tax=Streptomyces iconiensis TaxID=1384038 RepID=A0ABT6ZYF4_9ACTN|nr:helix-turn-helix transcriptional regulator [Streptomyces iconiensis]MDJ1133839.1 helix-turn-helix transcriptional regulator [Streptomyces iconiensis]